MSNVFLEDLTLEQFMDDIGEIMRLKGWHGFATFRDHDEDVALDTILGPDDVLVDLFEGMETNLLELMNDEPTRTLDEVAQDIENVLVNEGLLENDTEDENGDEPTLGEVLLNITMVLDTILNELPRELPKA